MKTLKLILIFGAFLSLHGSLADTASAPEPKAVSCRVTEINGHQSDFYDVTVSRPIGNLTFKSKYYAQLEIKIGVADFETGPHIEVDVSDSSIQGAAGENSLLASAAAYSYISLFTRVGGSQDRSIQIRCEAAK